MSKQTCFEAAAELRRLYSINAELLEALKTVKAFLPSDNADFQNQDRIPPGFVYLTFGHLRTVQAAIRRATEEA